MTEDQNKQNGRLISASLRRSCSGVSASVSSMLRQSRENRRCWGGTSCCPLQPDSVLLSPDVIRRKQAAQIEFMPLMLSRGESQELQSLENQPPAEESGIHAAKHSKIIILVRR